MPGALLLLCSIGLAQWQELRRHAARSGWWVAGNALAWCVGLGLFFAVAPPLWQPGQPPTTVIAIGVAAAILMAAGMALVTGLVMDRLLAAKGTDDPPPAESDSYPNRRFRRPSS